MTLPHDILHFMPLSSRTMYYHDVSLDSGEGVSGVFILSVSPEQRRIELRIGECFLIPADKVFP